MIDPNFQPPAPEISKAETAKRKNLLPWIAAYFDQVTDGIFVCGSLSYGSDYSVRPDSDIDIQIVLKEDAIDLLTTLDIYTKQDIEYALEGYKKGLYKQFTHAGEKDGVSIETHFWNKKAFINAITLTSQETPRLRSSIDTPSTDFAFTFDGSSDAIDYFGEIIEGYPVGVFPSFRRIDSVLYLCRPVTNILGGPIVLKTDSELDAAMTTCWEKVISELRQAQQVHPNPSTLSLVNALPSQYKMSPASKAQVIAKTDYLLSI